MEAEIENQKLKIGIKMEKSKMNQLVNPKWSTRKSTSENTFGLLIASINVLTRVAECLQMECSADGVEDLGRGVWGGKARKMIGTFWSGSDFLRSDMSNSTLARLAQW